MTLLLVEPESEGLQVERGEDDWIDVPPVPGALIVNIGELLEVATGGYLRATRHRVRAPRPGTDRVSIPYFLNPALDALVPIICLAARTGGAVARSRGRPRQPDLQHLRRERVEVADACASRRRGAPSRHQAERTRCGVLVRPGRFPLADRKSGPIVYTLIAFRYDHHREHRPRHRLRRRGVDCRTRSRRGDRRGRSRARTHGRMAGRGAAQGRGVGSARHHRACPFRWARPAAFHRGRGTSHSFASRFGRRPVAPVAFRDQLRHPRPRRQRSGAADLRRRARRDTGRQRHRRAGHSDQCGPTDHGVAARRRQLGAQRQEVLRDRSAWRGLDRGGCQDPRYGALTRRNGFRATVRSGRDAQPGPVVGVRATRHRQR